MSLILATENQSIQQMWICKSKIYQDKFIFAILELKSRPANSTANFLLIHNNLLNDKNYIAHFCEIISNDEWAHQRYGAEHCQPRGGHEEATQGYAPFETLIIV